MSYDKTVFDVGSIEAAKRIILTPERGSTERRWWAETDWLVERLLERWPLVPASRVLDYGCGVGRLAKVLIEKTGCFVVGVDISPSMRALANVYVDSPRFLACAPEALDALPMAFDYGLAVWVLQHCEHPQEDIARLSAIERELFILNNAGRALPVGGGRWLDDGVDIRPMLDQSFSGAWEGRLSPDVAPRALQNGVGWGFLTRSHAKATLAA